MNAIEELQIYADYEDTELSEYWNLLIQLAENSLTDDDIGKMARKAVKQQLEWVISNTEWIEEEVTTTIKRLKWHGE